MNVLGFTQKAENASGGKNLFKSFLFKEIIISRDKSQAPFSNPSFFPLENIFLKINTSGQFTKSSEAKTLAITGLYLTHFSSG